MGSSTRIQGIRRFPAARTKPRSPAALAARIGRSCSSWPAAADRTLGYVSEPGRGRVSSCHWRLTSPQGVLRWTPPRGTLSTARTLPLRPGGGTYAVCPRRSMPRQPKAASDCLPAMICLTTVYASTLGRTCMTSPSDRFERQGSLAPRDRMIGLDSTVVGVGAIGRQVALQLAALGARRLRLIDFDKVEATNITTQGYWLGDIGLAKVDATASAVWQLDPQMQVETIEDRFRPQQEIGDVVFCCVDSIETRAALWRAVGRRVSFWSDGRMLGEVMRMLTVACDPSRKHYPGTLVAPAEAQAGTCTSRGIIYTACIAAGLMTHQLTRWLRGLPVDADLS